MSKIIPFVMLFLCSTLPMFGQVLANENQCIFISNSHLDTQWNWNKQTTIDEYIANTLNGNFALFEKYPDFQFNFEGAIHYMWMKEYYPTEYEKLKKYVASGRWHISGGSINANDVIIPSAESLIRNFLYGQQFYKAEFGVRGGSDVMLPDCFGFPYSLPTIAKHCGMTGFHTQKLTWGSAYSLDLIPPFGIWQGVDGSQIYAVFRGEAYDAHDDFNKDMSYDSGMLNVAQDNYNKYGVAAAIRYVGTRGDRGGALRDESYTNGENTPYWLQRSMNSDGPLNVCMWTPDEIFEYLDTHKNDKYQIWDNELPLTTHGSGCYTSQAILKYWNRKGELLADAAEKSAVAAAWSGTMLYPQDKINESWINLLWHQHHDDLTGTSIPSAYQYTFDDHVLVNKTLANVLNNSVGAFARQMNTQVEGIPVLVYNPLSITRTDVVEAKIAISSDVSSIRVLNEDGEEVLSQVLGYDIADGTLSFLFKATVPSLGYSVYEILLNEKSELTSSLSVTETTLENDKYIVTVNPTTGDVSQIRDKKEEQNLLYTPIRMFTLDDISKVWPSWEIMYSTLQNTPTYVDDNVTVSIAESGPLRVSLKVTRTLDNSNYVQYIQLQDGEVGKRIDFVNEVDWQSRGKLLKVEFPMAWSNKEATYDLSLGTIKRGNNQASLYEVPGHQWADLTSTRGYGVSILNDCKYGWDKPANNILNLTLIHTPITENFSHQEDQDLGLNKFTYSVYGHADNWDERTQWEASRLNQPLMAFQAQKYDGKMGKDFSLASLNTDKVSIKALKKAEESDEIIVRVYELVGDKHDNVEITFAGDILSAREVNGVEESVGSASYAGNKLSFSIDKYQPKSFAVKLVAATEESLLPVSKAVEIGYNCDIMSSNSKRNDMSSTMSFAYPAELVPDTLVTDGISFVMGSRKDGYRNSYQCRNSDMTLPLSSFDEAKKVYILAASTNVDGTKAEVTIDGKTYSCNVPYHGKTIGSWDTEFNLGSEYCQESVAFTTTHRHTSSGGEERAASMHMYKYAFPCDDSTSEISIAENSDLLIFAVTLSDNENDDVVALSQKQVVPEFDYLEDSNAGCAQKLEPISVRASHYNGTSENGEKAVDNDITTKWCVTNSSSPWLEITFAEDMNICSWMVLNAAVEGSGYTTSALRLQSYVDGNWIDIDVVSGNKENKIIRKVDTFTTSRVRLQINKGEQNGYITRIYEFAVYGEPTSMASIEQNNSIIEQDFYLKGSYPNPSKGDTNILCEVPQGVNQATLHIYNSNGQLVEQKSYAVSVGSQNIKWNSEEQPAGIYYYFMVAQQNGKMIYTTSKRLIVIKN